jgi:protocatechuate 3,4-dioxygenase, alpha subunit
VIMANNNSQHTPTQTIGPFFHEGLKWAIDVSARHTPASTLTFTGRVLDGAGAPVADSLVEVWHPSFAALDPAHPFSARRAPTDADGRYTVAIPATQDGVVAYVTVFSRGVLKHLFTAAFADAAHVPTAVPEARRATLIPTREGNTYTFDIRLQGAGETVFFDYQ